MKSLKEISSIILRDLRLDVNEKELENLVTSKKPDVEHIARYINRKKNEIILPDGASEDLVQYVKNLYASEIYNEDVGDIILTRGCSLEGFNIIKYSNLIAGDASAILTRRDLFGGDRTILSDNLSKLRENALRKLKKKAAELGCNAVIGVDFDYITYAGEQVTGPNVVNIGIEGIPNVLCVAVSGTAVEVQSK